MTALAGLLTALLLWWLLKNAARGDPKRVVRLAKMAGGGIALVFAGLLLLRGRLDMAALLGGAGAWLLGWAAPPNWWPFGSGPVSLLRSRSVELRLARSGTMTGTVFAGEFAGRSLDDLGLDELRRLLSALSGSDIEGGRLVEAYLDRRFSGWREHAERDADFRRRADPQLGAMTEQEAHEILGLEPRASPDDVRAAHRRLIKRLHPDGGGSTYLASRVNQAKDRLLDRHR